MTSEQRTPHPGPSIGRLQDVRGTFDSSERRQRAIDMQSASGVDRADFPIPKPAPRNVRSTPGGENLAYPAEEDSRQARIVSAGSVAAGALLVGAGAAIVAHGAALPTAEAAVAAGVALSCICHLCS